MNLPPCRTDPVASRRITLWDCLIGYAVTLLGVPLAAGALNHLAVRALRGTGITRTAIGPLLQYGEQTLEMLIYSFAAAYLGPILSIPVVIWARAHGWFGWVTAMATGVCVAIIVLSLVMRMPLTELLGGLALPSALLGLAFWGTVRVLRPRAFISK